MDEYGGKVHVNKDNYAEKARVGRTIFSSCMKSLRDKQRIRTVLLLAAACSACILYASPLLSRIYRDAAHDANAAALYSMHPRCVIETCNDDWSSINGAVDANIDAGGCSVVRNMVRMSDLKPNITGHWCKAWRAVQRCEDKRYRYFIFRDDDTIFDVHRLLDIAVKTRAPVIASYKYRSKHVVTNWFLLDTQSEAACAKVGKWWSLARRHHPEHDQTYFNHIFKCGVDGLHCLDKQVNELSEVHCRSSLGSYRDTARQACLRYQIKPMPHLL